MLKKLIKNTWLWNKISKSDLYQRTRFPEQYRLNQIEPQFYKDFLRSYKSKNHLIFDVGANLGYKSVIFSKLSKRVVAFEPSNNLYKRLKIKFKGTNVEVHNCALGEKETVTDIYLVPDNEAYNSLKKKHFETTTRQRGIASMETVKKQQVDVKVLEDYIEHYGLPKYIKIDVEGSEREVISGLKSVVPLLSFEANLPEFREEAIECIEYLNRLSLQKYSFNFANENFFLMQKFISTEKAIKYLNDTDLQYVEIFVRLG